MSLYKKYIDTDDPNVKIKFSISFNKENYNWVTGQPKQKGYQLTAVPVERSGAWESFEAFSGFNDIIYPVERQSKKRLAKAIELFEDNIDKYLEWFENKGYKINKTETV